ncbi:MAG: hypothetical protein ETSY1_37460 [Candidatus Entotheonella factor]|uniref:Helix-turn-helix domain-containing protein n=1 Tax=Entotheonella factor TaxID=1429438 RepID=W4L7G7_ENTF1|nr:MAG: hypothetical protein ETSY1_37460 [Candidatus Entotheonella factor]
MSGWQNRQAVYALDLSGTQQLVLLGLVEHADDEGKGAFPSIERLAWLARCSVRTVQRILNELIDWGTVRPRTARIGGRGRRTVYDLDLTQGPKRPGFQRAKGRQGDGVWSAETPSLATAKGDSGGENPVTGDAPLKDLPKELKEELPNRACEGEPEGGTRQPALEAAEAVVPACHHGEQAINELDAAYEAIPEAERETWLERAEQALADLGMPEWMRIVPTVKEMALTLWVGQTIPGLAPG